LECPKNVVAPDGTVPRLVGREVVIEGKTLATTMALSKKFVRHNVDSICIAVAREELAPSANAVKGIVKTTRNGLVEVLRVKRRGEDGTIADNDLFSSDVGLIEALARKCATRSGHKVDELTDGYDDVWVLMIIVSFLYIRREQMMTKLVRRQGRRWLSDGSRLRRTQRGHTRRRRNGRLGHVGH
jgi:hypothetical protein